MPTKTTDKKRSGQITLFLLGLGIGMLGGFLSGKVATGERAERNAAMASKIAGKDVGEKLSSMVSCQKNFVDQLHAIAGDNANLGDALCQTRIRQMYDGIVAREACEATALQ